MRKSFIFFALAVMLLPGSSALVAAEQSAADQPMEELAADELSLPNVKVNINKDDAATLAAMLDGVGLKRAQAIVEYREANGPFTDAGELANVKGIGTRTVASNAGRIEVD